MVGTPTGHVIADVAVEGCGSLWASTAVCSPTDLQGARLCILEASVALQGHRTPLRVLTPSEFQKVPSQLVAGKWWLQVQGTQQLQGTQTTHFRLVSPVVQGLFSALRG